MTLSYSGASEADWDDPFIELLINDRQLLEREFFSIISANWGSGPVGPDVPSQGRLRWEPSAGEAVAMRVPRAQTHPPGWGYERSPPVVGSPRHGSPSLAPASR